MEIPAPAVRRLYKEAVCQESSGTKHYTRLDFVNDLDKLSLPLRRNDTVDSPEKWQKIGDEWADLGVRLYGLLVESYHPGYHFNFKAFLRDNDPSLEAFNLGLQELERKGFFQFDEILKSFLEKSVGMHLFLKSAESLCLKNAFQKINRSRGMNDAKLEIIFRENRISNEENKENLRFHAAARALNNSSIKIKEVLSDFPSLKDAQKMNLCRAVMRAVAMSIADGSDPEKAARRRGLVMDDHGEQEKQAMLNRLSQISKDYTRFFEQNPNWYWPGGLPHILLETFPG